jgi:glutaredoxin-like YruB-family protein
MGAVPALWSGGCILRRVGESKRTMKRVILYSSPSCPPCFAAKAFLQSRNVPFAYKDVDEDPVAMEEMMELKSQSTPTLVVGDEVMIGFDPDRLMALLEED